MNMVLFELFGRHTCMVDKMNFKSSSLFDKGLAAAQIMRLRKAGIKITVCVDKVAASGGYMMASVAHQIVCAPFAIVGSIGVVTE